VDVVGSYYCRSVSDSHLLGQTDIGVQARARGGVGLALPEGSDVGNSDGPRRRTYSQSLDP
jgi:hypothetical protein